MAADTADKAYGISGERDYFMREIGERKKIAFVDYAIDGIENLDLECRNQLRVAIQYQAGTRWVDVWREPSFMPTTDGTMPEELHDEDEIMEVEMTDQYIQVWLNINRDAYVNKIQLSLHTTLFNYTVPMRVAWLDASEKSITTLEQNFLVNLITPWTEEVQTNPCENAVATFKSKARDE
jgi:hypothetical protein